MLLAVLALLSPTLGLVKSGGFRVRKSIHNHKGLLKYKSTANSVQIAGEWDPNEYAPQEDIDDFERKGEFMNCLFPLSDADAGKAWPDLKKQRPPNSASSRFRGTLEGMWPAQRSPMTWGSSN